MYKSSLLVFVGVLVTTGFIRPQIQSPDNRMLALQKAADSPIIIHTPTLDTFNKNKVALSKEIAVGKEYAKGIIDQQKIILHQTDTMRKLAEFNSSKRAQNKKIDTVQIRRITNRGFLYNIFHKNKNK